MLTIPFESFIAGKAMWSVDKNSEIVFYCYSGHRSTMAMTILLTNGYTNITSLRSLKNAAHHFGGRRCLLIQGGRITLI